MACSEKKKVMARFFFILFSLKTIIEGDTKLSNNLNILGFKSTYSTDIGPRCILLYNLLVGNQSLHNNANQLPLCSQSKLTAKTPSFCHIGGVSVQLLPAVNHTVQIYFISPDYSDTARLINVPDSKTRTSVTFETFQQKQTLNFDHVQ